MVERRRRVKNQRAYTQRGDHRNDVLGHIGQPAHFYP